MSQELLALGYAAVPAFVASVVEWVEAFTIVLAVGNTRGWRSPIWGTLAGLVTLAVIVGVFGTPLVVYQSQIQQGFHLAIGILLLLFGMRWLRKAILRFAGIVALHDEELIYQREVAELRAKGQQTDRWDNIGFWFSFKAVLLEGLEVAFIVIALGAQPGSAGGSALKAAIVGALAAFVFVLVSGSILHKPLAFVPENFMKFVVGAMLTSFGIFWGAEGMNVAWAPFGEGTLLLILAGVCLVSLIALRMLAAIAPRGARVAAATSDAGRSSLLMSPLAAIWEQVYGLLVEDGQIAIGTLVAFVAAAGYAFVAGPQVRDSAGWLLFGLLMSLLLVNLYNTGRRAYARRARE